MKLTARLARLLHPARDKRHELTVALAELDAATVTREAAQAEVRRTMLTHAGAFAGLDDLGQVLKRRGNNGQ